MSYFFYRKSFSFYFLQNMTTILNNDVITSIKERYTATEVDAFIHNINNAESAFNTSTECSVALATQIAVAEANLVRLRAEYAVQVDAKKVARNQLKALLSSIVADMQENNKKDQ